MIVDKNGNMFEDRRKKKQMIEDKMIVIQKVVEEELIGEKHLNKYLRKNKFNIKKTS